MKSLTILTLTIILLCGQSFAKPDLSRAGDNADQLRKALADTPANQKEGMSFLIEYMPQRDLQSLSAEFLSNNVRFAYRAWNDSPWKDSIPKDIFLNDVLPDASINERRDDWREDFYARFKPLVADAKSPSEAAVILNRDIFKMLNVIFSRKRPKADQSPYETIEAGMGSCTGLSVLLIDACRAVGVPARFAGTPLWANKSGNHSWVEIWDDGWHYTGGGEPSGDKLDQAWFSERAATALRDHRMHAIYATSYKHTGITFPLSWNRGIDYVYAVNVTDRYATPKENDKAKPLASEKGSGFDVEASLHAVDQLKKYLETNRADRSPLSQQLFSSVALTGKDADNARQLLWDDHVQHIKQSRADEMKARQLTEKDLKMPFFYTVSGDKPGNGRSLYISMHGGGNTSKQANDRQWENQKRLYKVPEGVYVAPRAPTNTWDLWHQEHIDVMFDRLIENMIVFEGVNPNRVYIMGYSAGGDGVYQLAPRMADRFAGAAMMAGHPNEASPLGLRNIPFTIHVGANDSPYDRNKVASQWGEKIDALQKDDPEAYIHWTKIYEGKGHWLNREDAAALPWMAEHTRNPLPRQIVWKQDDVTHCRFYWLAVKPEDMQKGVEVRSVLNGQQFDVTTSDLDQLIIRVNDSMLDLDEDVIVRSQGKELFKGRVYRSIATLSKTLDERGDPVAVFSGEITVKF